MLNLLDVSSDRWLRQVDGHLAEVMIDHAHCERKAAGYAMSMINAYVEHEELCREMIVIVNEELEHFGMVLEILRRRGIPFTKQRASNYGSQLQALVRPNDPQRAIDRLLVASLIEARSCQRFSLLADHTADAELAEFYASLFESEARHHTTYVRLAKLFGEEGEVQARLRELSRAEAEIIERGDELPRMHS